MKNLALLCAAIACAIPSTAFAGNAAVENAIRSRGELSGFYQALQETGVLGELEEGRPYTVLAPDNSAINAMKRKPGYCFDTMQCREETAAILRSHIIPGKEYFGMGGKDKGGVFSIDRRFITVGQPSLNVYTVNGQRITDTSEFNGGVLYTINGVIIDRLLPFSWENVNRTTTVTKKTIADPACGLEGCPDAYSEVTIVTRRVADIPVREYPQSGR